MNNKEVAKKVAFVAVVGALVWEVGKIVGKIFIGIGGM